MLSQLWQKSPWKAALLMCLYSAVLLLAGIAAGQWATEHHIRGQIIEKLRHTSLRRFFPSAQESAKVEVVPDVQHIDWKATPPLISNLYFPQVVKVKLAPFESYGEGGSLEEVGGNILYASPTGQLGYLNRKNVVHVIKSRVPMRFDLLQSHAVSKDPRLVMSYFRTLDMLVVNGSAGSFQLYVSHHRFNSSGCFEFVVSRATGHVADDLVDVADDWKDVFVARPCMQTKEIDLLFGGLESGGRLQLLNAQTLLVSIGDHQFDGIRSKIEAAQDPNLDLGKVVAIDLASGHSRIYTSGHRNPQGLLVTRDGTAWETEHAPQGGDEINLLQEGRNYGWPRATYGVEYSARTGPRRDWPLNKEQGRHDGYEHPRYAFVPSIGISNLIQPDAREWPLWRDHLLVASLGGMFRTGGGKLYLVRPESDKQIVYAEEIAVPVDDGEKLRDIISLADGRIAVLSDRGNLLLIRNGEAQVNDPSPREATFDVTLGDDAKLARQNSTLMSEASESDLGRQVFASKCSSCHSEKGDIKIGPPLNGVVGRKIASIAGFTYSSSMKADGGTWDEWNLADFLQTLDVPYKDSPMPRPMLSARSARAVALYLKQEH